MGFLIIDGNSILNRAFYGIRVLTNSRGVATNAVTGFMNTLLMLEKDVNPDMIAVAFDLKAPTFRHKMYDGYKANRKGMPDDLAQHFRHHRLSGNRQKAPADLPLPAPQGQSRCGADGRPRPHRRHPRRRVGLPDCRRRRAHDLRRDAAVLSEAAI